MWYSEVSSGLLFSRWPKKRGRKRFRRCVDVVFGFRGVSRRLRSFTEKCSFSTIFPHHTISREEMLAIGIKYLWSLWCLGGVDA
ncbi:unnamed protein product [Linum trigynum]|uniref:Uncharacterized protein n=1 Tax=Linum trigynum TaxID=586398 RepID=A0AAV2E6J6_9ROSI